MEREITTVSRTKIVYALIVIAKTINAGHHIWLICRITSFWLSVQRRIPAKPSDRDPPPTARVILCGHRKDRLAELQAEIGERCHIAAFDVSDRAAAEATFTTLPAEFSEITVPVNNAGHALGTAPAQAASLDDWKRMVVINGKGVMYCTHVALLGMIEPARTTQDLRRQSPPTSSRSCTPSSRFQATSMSTKSK